MILECRKDSVREQQLAEKISSFTNTASNENAQYQSLNDINVFLISIPQTLEDFFLRILP